MKNFREKLAKKDGFTLVELVVVIAILGILAAVAVPAYTGYINNANEAADKSVLAAAQTAIDSACAMNGKSNSDITVTVTVDTAGDRFVISSDTIDTTTLGKIQSDCATFLNTTYATGTSAGIAIDLDYYSSVGYSGGLFSGTKS